jgi:hypothetical protein
MNKTPDSSNSGTHFHVIDLVPTDCCHSGRVDLQQKLQRLEESLNHWLNEKLAEIEANTVSSKAENRDDQDVGRILRDSTVQKEVAYMSTDDRDILEVLQAELDFIEKGGYGRSPRTAWKAKSPFQDSLTCINYAYPEKVHPCSACHLIDFVPNDRRLEQVPCHFIPLDESGATLDQLEAEDNEHKLEEVLKAWLRARIHEIQSQRQAIDPISKTS